ncbi:MAG: hypothetical protein GY803_11490 [Chloroflexi bacterium]|nr:hypothetical protein [Chloroflexota bacterium]
MMNDMNIAGEKRPFLRKLLFLITIGYLIGMAMLAVMLHRASPGPESQTITGVGIGEWQGEQGIALLSGRRLDCNQVDNIAPFTTLCGVEIADKLLEIQARRNEPPNLNRFGGECAAFYDGQFWPCKIGSRHVHEHWFAFIEPPLGLSAAQMDDLRQMYFIENLPEEPFLIGSLVTAVLATLLILANFFVWVWPKAERKAVVWATAVPIAFITFLGSLFWAIMQTGSFWD